MTTALALLATASAIGMVPIPRDQGFCRTDQSHYCYEWKLQSDSRRRLVARGDEDGVEYTFQSLDARGRHGRPVRIHPVIQDAEHQGRLFWGYAWDIRDIALAADGQSLLASFTHTLVDHSNVETLRGQQRIPAVLFSGHTTQPDMTVPLTAFAPSSLAALRAEAHRAYTPQDAQDALASVDPKGRTSVLLQCDGITPPGSSVCDKIETGDNTWLELAVRLAEYTDASASAGVCHSIARAARRAPAAVLRLHGRTQRMSSECICLPFVSNEIPLANQYRELRQSHLAITSVRDPALAVPRASCLAYIDPVMKQLQMDLPHSRKR